MIHQLYLLQKQKHTLSISVNLTEINGEAENYLSTKTNHLIVCLSDTCSYKIKFHKPNIIHKLAN